MAVVKWFVFVSQVKVNNESGPFVLAFTKADDPNIQEPHSKSKNEAEKS